MSATGALRLDHLVSSWKRYRPRALESRLKSRGGCRAPFAGSWPGGRGDEAESEWQHWRTRLWTCGRTALRTAVGSGQWAEALVQSTHDRRLGLLRGRKSSHAARVSESQRSDCLVRVGWACVTSGFGACMESRPRSLVPQCDPGRTIRYDKIIWHDVGSGFGHRVITRTLRRIHIHYLTNFPHSSNPRPSFQHLYRPETYTQ